MSARLPDCASVYFQHLLLAAASADQTKQHTHFIKSQDCDSDHTANSVTHNSWSVKSSLLITPGKNTKQCLLTADTTGLNTKKQKGYPTFGFPFPLLRPLTVSRKEQEREGRRHGSSRESPLQLDDLLITKEEQKKKNTGSKSPIEGKSPAALPGRCRFCKLDQWTVTILWRNEETTERMVVSSTPLNEHLFRSVSDPFFFPLDLSFTEASIPWGPTWPILKRQAETWRTAASSLI